MIRVFHVITHFDMGGAEKVAINIAKSKSKDFEYHLVEVEKSKGSYGDALVLELKSQGIHLHRSWVSNGKLAILLFWIKFLYLVLCWKPNVIHSHTEKPDLSIYIWHRLFGWAFPQMKYIRTIHNTQLWNSWKNIGNKVEKFFQNKQSNIAISESTQSCYVQNYCCNLPPIIYNGIEEVTQRKFEGTDSLKINILFAGRLEKQKGVDIMVNVFRKFAVDDRFRFYVIGSGTLSDYVCESLVKCNNVQIIDKVFGLSSYLGSFDYLFMPSIHEGLALMPIEAAMAKTPTIINSCPGLRDTMPKDWPLAVEDNNLTEYYQIFNSLDSFDREKLGKEVYQYVKEKFDVKAMQLAYEQKYKTICGM